MKTKTCYLCGGQRPNQAQKTQLGTTVNAQTFAFQGTTSGRMTTDQVARSNVPKKNTRGRR